MRFRALGACGLVFAILWTIAGLDDPWRRYRGASRGDELIVHSRGEDGLDDTADDITSVSSFYGVRPVPLVLSLIAWRNP